jgi:hypothetical protein
MRSLRTAACVFSLGLVLQAGAMVGAAAVITSASAAQFDRFTLAAGEAQQFQTDATFQNYRVCNDLGSPGPLKATIGDRSARVLTPGECTEDTGDTIRIQNEANGVVLGIFQPFGNSNGGQ